MQNTYSFFELHGIHGTIGTAPIVFNNLKHSGAPKALEHLRRIVLIAGLSKEKRVPEESPTSAGNAIRSLWLLLIHSSGLSLFATFQLYMNRYIPQEVDHFMD